MNLKEFRELAQKAEFHKDIYELFELKCKKCESNNVEFLGKTLTEPDYYGESYHHGYIVMKCHDCGNAKVFDLDKTNEITRYLEDSINLEKLK